MSLPTLKHVSLLVFLQHLLPVLMRTIFQFILQAELLQAYRLAVRATKRM